MSEYKEVRFDEYCKTCKYEKNPEVMKDPFAEDPCDECLGEPGRLYSHRPLNWEKKGRMKNEK